MNIERRGEPSLAPEEKPFHFEYMTDPEQRKMLAERTMDLVYETHDQKLDSVIFLDKSARPLSTLFRDLWHKRFHAENPPTTSFLNIGQETKSFLEKRLAKTNPELFLRDSGAEKDEIGFLDVYKLHEYLNDRNILDFFDPKEIERVRNQYTNLNKAKYVMMIDEVSISGDTLAIARKIVHGLFPNIKSIRAEALRGDSGSDYLFRDSTEQHINPPWRALRKKDINNSNLSGVTDQAKKPSFTAQPSTPNSPELAKKVQQIRNEMHALADEYWMMYGQHKTHSEIKTDIIRSVNEGYNKRWE